MENKKENGRPLGGAVLSITGNRSAVVDGCDGINSRGRKLS